jgi:hypothetical protein
VQVVRRTASVPFACEDWRDLPPPVRDRRLDELVTRLRLEGCDLAETPQLRLVLLRWDEESYRLVFLLDYMVLDGWSYPLVVDEAIRLQHALRLGASLDLRARPPYRDYVSWVERQPLPAAIDFWRRTLDGLRPRPTFAAAKAPATSGDDERFLARGLRGGLSAELTTALTSQARRHGLTLYTLVQGAWAAVVSAHSGSDDVVFGNALSGRPADVAGAEHVIGYCTFHVPARMTVTPSARLVPWLQGLQADQAAAREHGFCPLPRIRRSIGLGPGQQLYDTCLLFLDLPPDPAGPRPPGWRWLDSNTNTEHVLRLVVERGRSLQIGLAYRGGDLSAERVRSLHDEVLGVLSTMARSLDRGVGDLRAGARALIG